MTHYIQMLLGLYLHTHDSKKYKHIVLKFYTRCSVGIKHI